MKKDIMSAVMRLFRGWDISVCNSGYDLDKAKRKLFGALIAADMQDLTISETIVDIAIETWGTDVAAINNTFHKSFSSIENMEYHTLVYQQLLHYFTTYGAECFGCYDAFVFIPKEDLEIPEAVRGLKLVVIRPFTPEQIKEKLVKLANQNIGLSEKTLDDLMTLFAHYFSDITPGEIADISNREVAVRLYDTLNIIPTRDDEFLRFIIFKATDKTLLIKNRKVIDALRDWANSEIGLNYIHKAITVLDPQRLAQSYHRYHEYWLALKQKDILKNEEKAKTINSFINKISKLSLKFHKPLPVNVMQNICSPKITLEDIEKAVQKASDIQLLKTWGYLNFVASASSEKKLPRNYNIRNNTVWTKEAQPQPQENERIGLRSKRVLAELRKRFAHLENKKFCIPENISYPLFTSGKKTVGAIPQGTVIRLPIPQTSIRNNRHNEKKRKGKDNKGGKDNIIVAIHWYDVSDRVDLDLHALMKNTAVGWNSNYKTNNCDIIYSGDMTAAPRPGGATEAILVKGEPEDLEITFNVNAYTQNSEPVPFDIIIAYGQASDIARNCTINPNTIITKLSSKMIPGKSQQEVGTLIKNGGLFSFIVGGYSTGNNRVCSINEVQNQRRLAAKLEFFYYPDFADFLENIVCSYEISQVPEEADYDLSPENLQADTFSSMMFA